MKFTRRPTVIEAVQFLPTPDFAPGQTVGNVHHSGWIPGSGEAMYSVKGKGGSLIVHPGDWIITHPNGDLSACKPELFESLFAPVGE